MQYDVQIRKAGQAGWIDWQTGRQPVKPPTSSIHASVHRQSRYRVAPIEQPPGSGGRASQSPLPWRLDRFRVGDVPWRRGMSAGRFPAAGDAPLIEVCTNAPVMIDCPRRSLMGIVFVTQNRYVYGTVGSPGRCGSGVCCNRRLHSGMSQPVGTEIGSARSCDSAAISSNTGSGGYVLVPAKRRLSPVDKTGAL